ncbi:DMT family transporter [Pelomonas sp. KK5]|uniref:DMT family transporter n=1 Tax=Pelomonas sp. KK5 TaxID=1855730 RepID=UPI001E2C697D|nr:DMT family transporter [Pelomonas sp. KK5]
MVFVIGAVACFAALDTATKWVSLSAPALMTVWFRYVLQAVLTGGVLLPRRGRALLRTRRPGLQVLRACLLLASSSLAFLSLQHMPVGEYTAVTMITPLVVMVVAGFALGEFVPRSRWLFLGLGFAGALLVVAPGGASADRVMALPLLVVAINAGYQILTSRLAQVDAPATIQFYTGVIGAGIASLALPWNWAPLSAATWGLLVAMGLFSTLGHLLLTMAYTRAPVSLLTPYLYFQIAFGAFGGWWVFGHMPTSTARLGIAMIVLSGVLVSWARARPGTAAAQA